MSEATLGLGVSGLSSHKLLRTEVYDYLRMELIAGNLKPGIFISMNRLMKTLNISRTPLRDALLQLQSEGFVSFLPQRGILINELSPKDIENLYEILGALESQVLVSVFHHITPETIEEMTRKNREMLDNISGEKINKYFDLNIAFHNVYISMSTNTPLKNLIEMVRQRLYVFGKKDWSMVMRELNYSEHVEFISLLKKGNAIQAADYLRDTHCNYQILRDAEKSDT